MPCSVLKNKRPNRQFFSSRWKTFDKFLYSKS